MNVSVLHKKFTSRTKYCQGKRFVNRYIFFDSIEVYGFFLVSIVDDSSVDLLLAV